MTENWIKVRLGDIILNITDRIEKPSESGLECYIGLDQIDTDQIRIKRFASTSDVEATKFLCKKGDIIFGKRNAYLRKVAITDRDAVVSAHSMVFRPKGNLIDKDFLPCLLQSSKFWKIAHSISEGSMSPTIKWKTFAKQEVEIPQIKEQKRIAEILLSIENTMEKTENLIKVNEKLKKGLLNELLTKGIGHKKFKKTEIGEIPEDWRLAELQEVSEINMGQSPPSSSYNQSGEGIPFIQGKADYGVVYPEITSYTTDPRKKSKKGDILFTVRAPVGDMNWSDREYCIGRGVAAIRAKANRMVSKYLFYLLEKLKLDFESLSQGTTFTAINSKELNKFKITDVPIKEQVKIVKILESLDNQIYSLSKEIGILINLKKKLTDELLSGKLKIK